MKKKQRYGKKIAFVCAISFLVLVMIFSGLQLLESTVFYDRALAGEQITTKTIVKGGVKYFPRQDIDVMMVLGIDQMGPVQATTQEENERNADMVALLIFDETNETCSILCLNRDTMMHIPVLNEYGKTIGSYYGQLTIAHLYGTGMEDSCENTRTAVSNFLYGIPINHYVSLNMDAISILNDAVGGVTVTVTDDFSEIDPRITRGEYTLQGDQAITFVRSRKLMQDPLNVNRMERQKEFLNGFLAALRQKNSDSFVLSTYEKVAPYMVTDCTANVITSMMQRYAEYTITEIVSPEGENILGEKFYEFYPDEEKLGNLILRLFYAPKD